MQSREVGCENPIKQKSCLLCPIWTNLVNKDPRILKRLVDFIAVLVKNASRFLKLSSPLTRKQLKQRYVLSNFSGCPIFCYLAGKQGVRFKNSPGTGEAKFSLCEGKKSTGSISRGYRRVCKATKRSYYIMRFLRQLERTKVNLSFFFSNSAVRAPV